VRAPPRTLLRELVSFARNPLVVILLVASLITGILGDVVNASIIIVIVALSVGLDFYQTARSQRAADALRKLVTTHATALRDGQWAEVPFDAIVPGEIIRFGAGDLAPADGRLLEAKDLVVNQAVLTGESFPTDKSATDLPTGADTLPLDAAANGSDSVGPVVAWWTVCLYRCLLSTSYQGRITRDIGGRGGRIMGT